MSSSAGEPAARLCVKVPIREPNNVNIFSPGQRPDRDRKIVDRVQLISRRADTILHNVAPTALGPFFWAC